MAVVLLDGLARGWASPGTQELLPPARQNVVRIKAREIESDLRARRRSAAALATEGEWDAVRSMALWNVVVPARGVVALTKAKAMLAAIAAEIPARVIVLAHNESSISSDVQSSTASAVVRSTNGAGAGYSEEIILTGPRRSEEDFGPLVLALQLPDVPTATLWIESPAMDGAITKALLPLSHLLVVDTGRYEHPDELAALHRLTKRCVAEVSDLGWLRLSGFRMLFARLLDQWMGTQPSRDTVRITIVHRAASAASALLVAAGLACQMGGTPSDAWQSNDGQVCFTFTTGSSPANKVRVELDPRASEDECGPGGIIAIEMRPIGTRLTIDGAASVAGKPTQHEQDYVLRYTHDDRAEIRVPAAPPRSVKLDSPTDAELWVDTLGPNGCDPQLPKALATAAWLADRLARRETA